MEKMYTINETAELIKVSKFTIRNWITNGVIKSVKIGGAVRINESEIVRLQKGE